ncbi:MAG TPA: M23 family metallopeptidase [Lysobacter sp.]|jgi:hypothetical protein|nr:M23 family metallopeptidase [Lysobacter sp.]
MKPWLDVLRISLATLCLLVAYATGAATPLHSSLDLQVPAPPTAVPVAGVRQLVYELHITNLADHPLSLARVQVLDADNGIALLDVRDAALESRLGRPGLRSTDADRRAIAAGMRAVLYLEIPLGADIAVHALRHRIEYDSGGASQRTADIVEGAPVAIAQQALPMLGPPLRGGPWAAVHEPSWPRGHRRVLFALDGRARIPGRYAIDWILLDDRGHYARGDDDRVSAWFGHGADVLAVADGVVTATRDDVTESASIAAHPRHPLEDATGNYVALDLGNGRYAFYEHLKPGSIRVAPGQSVRRGQVLAALGFTGDSTGPHLHFHVADANSPLSAEGQPYVFDRFELFGQYESFDAFGKQRWQPRAPSIESHRQGERPPPNSVIEFDR